MTTCKIIGKYENKAVYLFDNPIVCTTHNLKAGDIVELEGDYGRMYEDGGKGLRVWFITTQVMTALIERQTAIIRAGIRRQFAPESPPIVFDEREKDLFLQGTGRM